MGLVRLREFSVSVYVAFGFRGARAAAGRGRGRGGVEREAAFRLKNRGYFFCVEVFRRDIDAFFGVGVLGQDLLRRRGGFVRRLLAVVLAVVVPPHLLVLLRRGEPCLLRALVLQLDRLRQAKVDPLRQLLDVLDGAPDRAQHRLGRLGDVHPRLQFFSEISVNIFNEFLLLGDVFVSQTQRVFLLENVFGPRLLVHEEALGALAGYVLQVERAVLGHAEAGLQGLALNGEAVDGENGDGRVELVREGDVGAEGVETGFLEGFVLVHDDFDDGAVLAEEGLLGEKRLVREVFRQTYDVYEVPLPDSEFLDVRALGSSY